MRLAGLFGVLENATKTQLYRFTGLNRQLASMVPIAILNPQVDGLLFLENAGYGWLAASGPVIRRSFENCPLGTEENGSFLSRGGVAGYRPPRIGLISYVWTHIPNHAEKYDIKTAGSRLVVFEKTRVWSGARGQT